VVNDEEVIDKYVDDLTSTIQEAQAATATKSQPTVAPRRPLAASIPDEIRLKEQRQITRDPVLKDQVKRLQMSVTHQLNEWRTNSGARRWNSWTVWTNHYGR
jgi:hypothetical protein